MCGIVGYVGHQQGLPIVLEGLRRLEYRGYDSAGIGVVEPGAIRVIRRTGRLEVLEKALALAPALPGLTALGHTRWATHGQVTERNAHPQSDCAGRIVVVHNGIVENFSALRTTLTAAGHVFASDTDTECVAHLVEDAMAAGGSLADAVRTAVRQVEGSFALVVACAEEPTTLVAARRHVPLVAGRGNGENFVASDFAAFLDHTTRGVIIEDDQIAVLTPDSLEVTTLDGSAAQGLEHLIDWDVAQAERGGFPHFMLKEIHEQPLAVQQTLEGRTDESGRLVLDELRMSEDELREVDKVFVVACGSAYHAGLVAKYAIEHWARLPVEIDVASEFRYRDPILDRNTLVIAISQSGETADTLASVRYARRQHARVLTVCNTVGASIPRDSDAVLYTRAGPEIGVAATKTFATQLVAMYLVALYLAEVRGTMLPAEVGLVVRELERVPDKLKEALGRAAAVESLAASVANAAHMIFIGRHVGYPLALEGALKLKEISYVHAEAYPGGELKHGPIALIEQGTPVIAVHPSSHVYAKTLTNMQQVSARGAHVIAIAEDGDHDVAHHAAAVLWVPALPALLAPLTAIVPLQLFSYYVAVARGCPIDTPRNLAKSVTVE